MLRNNQDLYHTHAQQWWNPSHPFARSLHAINDFRLRHIKDKVPHVIGKRIIDIGAGGGLLSVPLQRAGASCVPIDLCHASLTAARAEDAALHCTRASGLCLPIATNTADIVLCADFLEHVPRWPRVLQEVSRILRPGGLCFITTINRNVLSRLVAVHLAEGLGLIPRGTHHPDGFIQPQEIIDWACRCQLQHDSTHGEQLAIKPTLRHWAIHLNRGASTKLGYTMWLQRCHSPKRSLLF